MNAQQSLLSRSRWKLWEPALWLLAFAVPMLLPSHALIINEIAIVALFAISLDLILGYTGIVSLGHAAFFGIGGYAAALFAKLVMPDPLVGLVVGIAVATLLGAVCSFTIMRGSDLTRLMVTLGVGLILLELANKFSELTGGSDGLQGVVHHVEVGGFVARLQFRSDQREGIAFESSSSRSFHRFSLGNYSVSPSKPATSPTTAARVLGSSHTFRGCSNPRR